MKCLVVCSIFPPDSMGGAELSAYNCAKWLMDQGHDVSVLTTAKVQSEEVRGTLINGMKTWRLFWPRIYSIQTHASQSSIRKTVWHFEDHFHPANPKLLRGVIREVQPDFINLHLVAGIGHNALSALKDFPDIPINYFLHDLGLACVLSTMYRSGKNCERKCAVCQASSLVKFHHIRKENTYTFISPSASNLATLEKHTPLKQFPSTVMPNFDFEPALPRVERAAGTPLRLIYIGRLHATKGVDFLLTVFEKLAREGQSFHITVVGGGQEEKTLRKAYQHHEWVTFTGRIAPSQVKSALSAADVLCVPSLWRENHPGVVRQALRAGIPALVSDAGGSAEMIEPGQSGMVLPSANSEAWRSALLQLILNEDLTKRLQNGAVTSAHKYDVDVIGRQMNAILTAAMERVHRHKGAVPVVASVRGDAVSDTACEMTRILYITARADIGGGQECLYRLAKQTAGDAEVFIASPREEPYWSRYRNLLGEARLVEIPHRKLSLETIKKLSAFVRDNGIQLIHSHGFGAGLYGRSVAILTGVPAVHTFHGLVFKASRPFWTIARLCVEWCLSAASKSLIVVSESEQKHLKRWLFPYARKIHKIHNGIPTHQPSRDHLVSTDKPARVLWVGRMCEQKDPFQVVDVAIRMRAMLSVDRFTIEMVGDGPLMEELKERVARSGLGNVVLIRGSSGNVRPYYEGCDILLSTSNWEGLPTCILEAMEAGLLVLASGVQGNLDIVDNLRTGLVFNKRSPLHAAEILSSVVRGEVDSCNMRDAAKKRVLSAFGVERFAEEHLSLYRTIAHEEVMTTAI